MKKQLTLLYIFFSFFTSFSQDSIMTKLPDTGQITSYSKIPGEDSDYLINPPSFTDNGDGTIKDNVTKLIWQKTDGGEMTWQTAKSYCSTLSLAGYKWRLPNSHELFSILNHDKMPAINTVYFPTTTAQYWWTGQTRVGDTTVWVANSGGGIGAHPKNETVSAGGIKYFNARCVKDVVWHSEYTDNGNGTISDSKSGFMWQKIPFPNLKNWFDALRYADTLSLGGYSDWRLPNIKELQSISEDTFINPSVNPAYFPSTNPTIYWSSTSQKSPDTTHSWTVDFYYGIASYNLKTETHYIRCVRGNDVSTNVKNIYFEKFGLNVSPNPANKGFVNLNVNFNESENNDFKIEVYNLLGQLIISEEKGNFSKGKFSFSIDVSKFKADNYFIKCTTTKSQNYIQLSIL